MVLGTMTVDVEVNVNGNEKVSTESETEVEDKCSYQDLNKGGDCNGLKQKQLEEEETGKDDCGDASYVFVTGNDIAASDPTEVTGLEGDGGIKNENVGSEDQGIDNGVDNAVSTNEGAAEEFITTAAVTESESSPFGEEDDNVESSMEEISEAQRIVVSEVTECKGELPFLDHEKEKAREVSTTSVAESDQPLSTPGDENSKGESNSYLVAENRESQSVVTVNVVQNEMDQMKEPVEITSKVPNEVPQMELELEVESNLENQPADVQTDTQTTDIDQDRVTLPSDHAGDSVTGAVLSNGSLAGNHIKAEENGPPEDVETLPSPDTGSASSEVPVVDLESDTGVDGNDTVANENKDGFLSEATKEIVSEATLDNQQNGFSNSADNLPSKIIFENVPVESSASLPSVTMDNTAINSTSDDARTEGEGEVEISVVKSDEYSVCNPAKNMNVEFEVLINDRAKTIPLDNAAEHGAVDDARGKSDVIVKSNECVDSIAEKNAGVESTISVALDKATTTCVIHNVRTESGVDELDVETNGCCDSNPTNHVEVELEVNDGHAIEDIMSSDRRTSDEETAIETSLNFVDSGEKSSTLLNGDANSEDNRFSENMDGESHTVALVKNQVTVADVKAESDMSSTDVSDNNSIVTMENEGDESTGIDGADKSKVSTASLEGSIGDAYEEHDMPAEPVKRPFYYLIKVPRFEDENLKEQIRQAQSQLDEKTQSRDAVRPEIQRKRVNCKEYADNLNAAISEEKTLRDLLRAKRKEIESLQAVSNRARNAISVEGIEGMIRNMEHNLQHETLTLKEEKLLIREMKQLKQQREQVFSSMGTQEEVQEAIEQKEDIEERLKFLRKEADFLRAEIFKAGAVIKDAKKKLNEESQMLNELQAKRQAADDVRQEAYVHLQSLKKQSFERSKFFFNYRDDKREATDLASAGDKEALQWLCVNQVERVMELWNGNSEFRKDYMRCNMRSTLWRLRTLDGRSLGPDEDAPVIRNFVNERVHHAVPPISIERIENQVMPHATKADDIFTTKVADQKNQTAKTKKPTKHAASVSGSATVSDRDEIKDMREEEHKRTMEEEESARKAEQLRKEEQAAKFKEQRRLEEKTKAAEALERKKRIAEKAQAKAALRLQREAEQKEKEKEKRARKKEKRRVAAGEDANDNNEGETIPSSETITETLRQSEIEEKLVAVTKRPQKAPQMKLHSKAKSIPLPLRNRGKKRMQTWMWVVVAALVVLALFMLVISQRFGGTIP